MASYETLKHEIEKNVPGTLKYKFIEMWKKYNNNLYQEKQGVNQVIKEDNLLREAKINFHDAYTNFDNNVRLYKISTQAILDGMSKSITDASNNVFDITGMMDEKISSIKERKIELTKFQTTGPYKKDHYIRKNYTYVNLGLTTVGVSILFYILFRQINTE
jgi:hypothetical protein